MLLAMSQEPDIVVIQLNNARIQQAPINDYRVRRYISQWLDFLKANHPDYADIAIDSFRSSQMPVDAVVTNQLVQHNADNSETVHNDVNDEELAELVNSHPVHGVVPDLNADQSELEQILEDASRLTEQQLARRYEKELERAVSQVGSH